ncbi:ADP-heptose--lipooligosaccharide heptosyltransferase II [Arcticibacter svalbardensis MN12-7]|uniref:ADP-heptose--lipooligosaccharide heptosyltransferase II n=1 Tax=Arcticibacter svalbardensis MN12-7 TaxID=1150600 RepID=R9H2X4_9SPHI|nr:glycosyltransferase family 9 protein [Arcticibacter svalbardensis]EOR95549.1 ADP-heptose--lipooligosaccharide heptosyltransferase II [Arcticibacter svalbardensis MN12-7]
MKLQANYKNILCIRPDNLGDLLMSSPAIRALKETFNAKITVLTSSMAAGVAKLIPEIDEVMICDFPWVKNAANTSSDHFLDIIGDLKKKNFDLAVMFTVYSQNPLPATMLAYLAEIPVRLAYCRENPYDLLTHWLPDQEPYKLIKHQVRRDLDLVKSIGATPSQENLALIQTDEAWNKAQIKLNALPIDLQKPWLILHAGVSEQKRTYPLELWVQAAQKLMLKNDYQILFTGGAKEKALTDQLAEASGGQSFSLGGLFSIEEFVALISKAPLVISVNTGTIHLAAATKTPVIVLYALSNPQHAPWKSYGKVLPFTVPNNLQSKNEVIRYVNATFFSKKIKTVSPADIFQAVQKIRNGKTLIIPEIPESFIN